MNTLETNVQIKTHTFLFLFDSRYILQRKTWVTMVCVSVDITGDIAGVVVFFSTDDVQI